MIVTPIKYPASENISAFCCSSLLAIKIIIAKQNELKIKKPIKYVDKKTLAIGKKLIVKQKSIISPVRLNRKPQITIRTANTDAKTIPR